MPLSYYDVSIADFIYKLKVLTAILEKGEAHAKEVGDSPDSYLELKLAPDMLPLKSQIFIASNMIKFAAVRVAGVENEVMKDEASTMADLKDRIARTIAFLEKVPKDAMEGKEDTTIAWTMNDHSFSFTGKDYLLRWVLPNFYFHITTTYNLLRSKGVQLGKANFLYPGGDPTHV